MIERIRASRPSSAGVVAVLALVLALGTGGAYAAQKIGSGQIAKSAVKSKQIKDGHVRGPDLAKSSVSGAKVANDAIGTREIGDGSVSGVDIALDTIGNANIGAAAVGSDEVEDGSLTALDLASASVSSVEIRDGQVRSADLGPLRVRSNSVEVAGNGTDLVIVQCAAGETVLSGGGVFDGAPNPSKYLLSSFPSGNTWVAQGRNGTTGATTLRGHALCLQV